MVLAPGVGADCPLSAQSAATAAWSAVARAPSVAGSATVRRPPSRSISRRRARCPRRRGVGQRARGPGRGSAAPGGAGGGRRGCRVRPQTAPPPETISKVTSCEASATSRPEASTTSARTIATSSPSRPPCPCPSPPTARRERGAAPPPRRASAPNSSRGRGGCSRRGRPPSISAKRTENFALPNGAPPSAERRSAVELEADEGASVYVDRFGGKGSAIGAPACTSPNVAGARVGERRAAGVAQRHAETTIASTGSPSGSPRRRRRCRGMTVCGHPRLHRGNRTPTTRRCATGRESEIFTSAVHCPISLL